MSFRSECGVIHAWTRKIFPRRAAPAMASPSYEPDVCVVHDLIKYEIAKETYYEVYYLQRCLYPKVARKCITEDFF